MTPITVPNEARRILTLLAQENPALKISKEDIRNQVTFEGNETPMLPGGLKSDALCAAIFSAFGLVADQIARQRFGGEPSKVKVNTTHATLFLANVGLFSVNGKFGGDKDKPAPNWEEDGMWGPPMHSAATRIYETKDGRYFQLHGDLNASFLLKDIGLEDKRDISLEEAQQIVANWVKQYTADELEKMMVEQKHSGSKCYKPEEWLATDMGKALAARPLCDVRQLTPPTNEPVPYLSPSNAKRILEGIKVVEMVRVIAGPTIGRTLAELGARVIKVNPPHLRDITMLQYTLTAGKHTVALDARDPKQKAQLEELVSQADVFINGFRPNSLERLGFGKQRVLELVKKARGENASIVYVDESSYGPEGPYNGRPGWQQIGDTASGASYVQGRTLGLDNEECVLPPLPISDLLTGIVGATSILCALRDRAVQGGSYYVSASLVKVKMVNVALGTYPEEIIKKVAAEYDFGSMRAIDNVSDLLFKVIKGWKQKHPREIDLNGDSPFFVEFQEGPLGKMRIVAPVTQIENYPLKWDHPPRPYGNDEPTFVY